MHLLGGSNKCQEVLQLVTDLSAELQERDLEVGLVFVFLGPCRVVEESFNLVMVFGFSAAAAEAHGFRLVRPHACIRQYRS